MSEAKPAKTSMWIDLGPALSFTLIYNLVRFQNPDQAIYIAIIIFMLATIAAISYSLMCYRTLSPLLIISCGCILVFGVLTLVFNDPVFFKIKPTLINIMFAIVILAGTLTGKNPLKSFLGESLSFPDPVWRILAYRWSGFFLFMAGLNEFIWRNFSEAFWVNAKLILGYLLTFIFMIINVPLIMKYKKSDDITD